MGEVIRVNFGAKKNEAPTKKQEGGSSVSEFKKRDTGHEREELKKLGESRGISGELRDLGISASEMLEQEDLLSQIDEPKLDLIQGLIQGTIISRESEALARKHFKDWTKKEIIDYINNCNELSIKRKPAFFITALKIIVNY